MTKPKDKKRKSADFHVQFRPGIELGTWLETEGEKAGLTASELAKAIVVAARFGFGPDLLPHILRYTAVSGGDVALACDRVRGKIQEVDAERKAQGRKCQSHEEVVKFVITAVNKAEKGDPFVGVTESALSRSGTPSRKRLLAL